MGHSLQHHFAGQRLLAEDFRRFPLQFFSLARLSTSESSGPWFCVCLVQLAACRGNREGHPLNPASDSSQQKHAKTDSTDSRFYTWVWVKIKPPGDHRLWSLFLFTDRAIHFGVAQFLTHSHILGVHPIVAQRLQRLRPLSITPRRPRESSGSSRTWRHSRVSKLRLRFFFAGTFFFGEV